MALWKNCMYDPRVCKGPCHLQCLGFSRAHGHLGTILPARVPWGIDSAQVSVSLPGSTGSHSHVHSSQNPGSSVGCKALQDAGWVIFLEL